MIKTSSKQSGSAHVVIIVILVIALVGMLGFAFWKNYMNKDDTKKVETGTSVKKEDTPKPITYKTYQTDTHPVSFRYPDTWSLENAKADNNYGFHRSVDVKTDRGDVVSFSTGGQGIGGTCGSENNFKYEVTEVVSSTLKTPTPTVLSYTVISNKDGSYDARYGLTPMSFIALGQGETCMYYYLFDSGSEVYHLMAFGGTKHFASIDDAKKFVSSDEYASIKKMILSLSY
jgi:hypothetical protein